MRVVAILISSLIFIAVPFASAEIPSEENAAEETEATDTLVDPALEVPAATVKEEPQIIMRPKAKAAVQVVDKLKKDKTKKSEKVSEADTAKSIVHFDDHKGVAPDKALGWLKNGNTRYLKNIKRADGKSVRDRQRLTSGEHPHTIVLSCSDSRVPPEVVFDQSLGEIFVIRVAGASLDSSVVASIEYAVDQLGVKLLVVMGHSQCSAVKAALTSVEKSAVTSADMDHLLSDIRPHLKTIKDAPSANFEVEAAVNADGVARDLVRRSEIVRKRVETGELVIKTALYRIDSGTVNFY